LPVRRVTVDTATVIPGVIVHLVNDLPIVVDMDELPSGGDRSIRCTNVRTVDGKRPSFIHDRHSTFVFPLSVIRLIEAPSDVLATASDADEYEPKPLMLPPPAVDEEPDEDLLARIRSV
jgi:hypothetical protein